MKIIKLTLKDSSSIYVNIEQIGYFRPNDTDSKGWNTRIGITTHNNGGFDVKETPSQIIEMCNEIEDRRNGGKAYIPNSTH